MKIINLLGFALAPVGALLFSTHASGAAFQNGSFESGSTGYTTTGNVALGTFGSSEGTTSGTQSAIFNLGQTLPNAVVSQTFDTTGLQVYRVAFDFGNYGVDTGIPIQDQELQIEVRNGGTTTELITLGTGTVSSTSGGTITQNTNILKIQDSTIAPASIGLAAPTGEFSAFTFQFTALSGSSTIVITDISTGIGADSDAVLDNIRISAVPEPGTWASMVGGLFLLGSLQWFRRGRKA